MIKKSFDVVVLTKLCKGCGLCISLCPKGVLARQSDGKSSVVKMEECIGCNNCVLHCPDFCIEVTQKEAE